MTLHPRWAAHSDDALAEHLLTRDTVALPAPLAPTPQSLANADRICAGRWLLVGEEHLLAPGAWQANPSHDKEWQIAQHKFYFGIDLVQAYRQTGDVRYIDTFTTLLESWLTDMGTGFVTRSDAQVEAKRLESWVAAYVLLRETEWRGHVDGGLLRRWVERMGDEAAYVATHLKPVRNHRTFQLWSVFLVATAFPELAESARLADFGCRELTANLLTDLLPDGVQVEMSTHYHQLVAETAVAFVDLARRNGRALDRSLERRVHAALRWSMWLQHPDGSIPLLGDSDDGDHRAMLLEGSRLFDDPQLLWAATLGAAGTPPDVPSAHFPDAGYVVMSDGWGTDPETYAGRTHIVYDAARLGEGSHSHYDLFTFTFFCNGGPAVVDPGRFTYSDAVIDGVDWRHAFKCTLAHNTVAVDGRDQTRYLSRTKHGPEVIRHGVTAAVGAGPSDWVVGSAVSQEYTPVHTRLFLFALRQYAVIVDHVALVDDAAHTATLSFHLPPLDEWPTLRPLAPHHPAAVGVRLVGAPLQLLCCFPSDGRAETAPGWVSREYGIKAAAPVLRVAVRSTGRDEGSPAGERGSIVLASALAARPTEGRGVHLAAVTSERTDGDVVVTVRGSHGGAAFTDVVRFCDRAPLAGFTAVRRDASGAALSLTHAAAPAVE